MERHELLIPPVPGVDLRPPDTQVFDRGLSLLVGWEINPYMALRVEGLYGLKDINQDRYIGYSLSSSAQQNDFVSAGIMYSIR